MRTIGVEEELLLVGSADGQPAAVGDQVVVESTRLAALGATDPTIQIEHEFKQEQAEIATTPCTTLVELRAELVALRHSVAQAAELQQAVVAAIATSPVKVRPHQTPNERYARMNAEFGLLARQQLTCGQHVHVGVESRDEGIAVLDRMRPWLPVLLAISSNSPFWQGTDTGYASYRSVLWNQWPSAGPTEVFGSVAEYDQQVRQLIATGAALDEGMVYFSARLSARFPTVEIRVADVCTDVDDAVLIAALCRALVETSVALWREDVPAARITTGLLRAAHWRAARFGMDGPLFDLRTAEMVDSWQLIDQFIDHVSPALTSADDADIVAASLARLRDRGSGARQQRNAAERVPDLHGVVLDAAERTLRG